jgi:protein O-mannosyl-transferase
MTPNAVSQGQISTKTATARPTRDELTLAALLVALTWLVYWQVCRFEFVDFDDGIYVASNLHVIRGLSLNGIRWAIVGFHDGNWIPLTWLSLMLDGLFYGESPGGYHVTNLLLHTANVLLVFAVFNRATGQMLRSAFVAGLFAIHPLHVESVAWVSERKDVLSIFFGLLSLNAYVTYCQRQRIGRLVLAFVFFVCSLASKATLVTLPFVFLLLDYWPLGRISLASGGASRPRSASRLLVEKLPFFAASAAFCAIVMAAQSAGGGIRDFSVIPFGMRCLNAVLVYGLYLRNALLPIDLCPYYPHPWRALSMTGVGLSAAFLIATTAFAIAHVRRRPFVLFGWLWYLGTLVPLIGLVQIGGQQLADRYTYFPLLGIYVAVAWLICSLVPVSVSKTRFLPSLATAIIVAYAAIAYVQVGYWHDGITLFRHTVTVTHDDPFALRGLSSALFRKGELAEAYVHLQRSVEMDPGDSRGHYSLGRVLQKLGRINEAAEQYRAALAIEPDYADAHNDLGLLLVNVGQFTAAEQHLKRAIELQPDFAEANVNLGLLYLHTREYEKCIVYSERALELNPALVGCNVNIAYCLDALGKTDEAIERLRRLLAVSPNDKLAKVFLPQLLAKKNRM